MFAKNNIYLITHYSQLSPCGHTTMTTERLLGLAMVTIHFETPIDYDAVVHFFCGKIPNSASCWSRVWGKPKIDGFINANLHCCFTAFSYILIQKVWHFHFNKIDIKTSWPPQNGRNHISEDLKFQTFRGRMPEDPPPPPLNKAVALSFHWTPYAKNLDPPQRLKVQVGRCFM